MGGRVLSAGVLLGVYCFAVPPAFLPAGMPAVQEKAESPWRTDFEKAFAEAKAGRKPVFVVFRCEH